MDALTAGFWAGSFAVRQSHTALPYAAQEKLNGATALAQIAGVAMTCPPRRCSMVAMSGRGYSRGGSGISAFRVSTSFDSPSWLVRTASNMVARDTWFPKSAEAPKPTILT